VCDSFVVPPEWELPERRRLASQANMTRASFFDGWHNPVQPHVALNYRSPQAREAAMEKLATET